MIYRSQTILFPTQYLTRRHKIHSLPFFLFISAAILSRHRTIFCIMNIPQFFLKLSGSIGSEAVASPTMETFLPGESDGLQGTALGQETANRCQGSGTYRGVAKKGHIEKECLEKRLQSKILLNRIQLTKCRTGNWNKYTATDYIF